ncbi:MAG: hypothetical protein KGO50_13800, partial [Myxococcales bacterium]|nr:hypothetical protein [Myxococcales bacterium]
MSSRSRFLITALLGLSATGLVAGSAFAEGEPACASLPNPVYGIGGSAQKPTVGDFAAAFRNAAEELTIVYASPGACFAMSAFIDGTPITGTANFWNADGTEGVCTLPLTGVPAEFGIMGNTPTTCPGVEGLPDGIGQFEGPVLGWNLIVPTESTQQVISSEGLYFVYGFESQGQVAPWTDDAQIFSRNGTSAAGIAVARAAGLPVERLGGIDVRNNGAMVTNLAGSTNQEAAIGFVSGDVADRSRADVRTLAYQHIGQSAGFWPDSTASTFDKINIRDGHYWLWTATYFYSPVDGSGNILSANAERFINYAIGVTPPDDEIPAFEILVEGSNIPRCAMHVTRAGDYTELLPYTPA